MNGDELTKFICSNIKRERKAHGLTMQKVADRMGVEYQSIFNFECGRSLPRPQNLCDLAECIGCDVMDFFKGESTNEV